MVAPNGYEHWISVVLQKFASHQHHTTAARANARAACWGVAWLALPGKLRVGGGERDVADRLDGDAVMSLVEPDQRLPHGLGPVDAGVNLDTFPLGIRGSLFHRSLDARPRLNVVATVVRHRVSAADGNQKDCTRQRPHVRAVYADNGWHG